MNGAEFPVRATQLRACVQMVCCIGVAGWLAGCGSQRPPVLPGLADTVDTIAFGSASRQNNSQPFWDAAQENRPDVWIWAGDIVYAAPGDAGGLQRAFQEQESRPDYSAFRRMARVYGVWNQTDYGQTPGRADNPIHDAAREALLDFLGEPQLSPLRTRRGVYASHVLGPAGRRVRIVLLDVRTANRGPNAGEIHSLLGGEQWAWLETQLSAEEAQLTFIVSPIPMLSDPPGMESWRDYPGELEVLFRLLGNLRVWPVVFLSGGRLLGELSAYSPRILDCEIYELTAGGLTYFDHEYSGDINPLRQHEVFIGRNFGLVRIDWEMEPPALTLSLRDDRNRPGLSIDLDSKRIRPKGGKRERRLTTPVHLGLD